MDDKLTVKDVIGERMRFLTQRQKVIATNVAQADTPNYEARDLDDRAFRNLVGRKGAQLLPASTSAGHISNNPLVGKPAREQDDSDPYEASPSGNLVNLEEQMILSAENQMNYQTMVRLYRKQNEMMKLVLRR
ncbi:flagellar basal body rod protein FlgB [Kiloniella sp. b19]|uniref:flagellar basal body rod protein FlgB n=1 Tax=Kiloniella sp. GXU_MW_B19 TaxID=3141326 RepID=UPI0031DAE03C